MAVTNERLKNYLNEDNLAFLKNYIDAVIKATDNLDEKNDRLADKAREETITLLSNMGNYIFSKGENTDPLTQVNDSITRYNNFITTLPKFSPQAKRLHIALSALGVAFLVTGIIMLTVIAPPLAAPAAIVFSNMGWMLSGGGILLSAVNVYNFFSMSKSERGLGTKLSKAMKGLADEAESLVTTDKTKLGSGTEVDAPSDPSPDEFVASPSVG